MPGKYPDDIKLVADSFNRDSQEQACQDIQAWMQEDMWPMTFTEMADASIAKHGDEDAYTRRHYSNMVARYFGPDWGDHTFEYIESNYAGKNMDEKLAAYRQDLKSGESTTEFPQSDREREVFKLGFELGRKSTNNGFDLHDKGEEE